MLTDYHMVPLLPYPNPRISKKPSHAFQSRPRARNRKSATLTRKWLTMEAPMILMTKIILIRAMPLAPREAANRVLGNESDGRRTRRITVWKPLPPILSTSHIKRLQQPRLIVYMRAKRCPSTDTLR